MGRSDETKRPRRWWRSLQTEAGIMRAFARSSGDRERGSGKPHPRLIKRRDVAIGTRKNQASFQGCHHMKRLSHSIRSANSARKVVDAASKEHLDFLHDLGR